MTPTIRQIVTDALDCACSATQRKAEALIAALEERERRHVIREGIEALGREWLQGLDAAIWAPPRASVGYYTERESPMGWALFAAPGDNGYPSRFVAHLSTPTRAERCAQTLQYIAGQYGAAQARECELAAVEVARA